MLYIVALSLAMRAQTGPAQTTPPTRRKAGTGRVRPNAAACPLVSFNGLNQGLQAGVVLRQAMPFPAQRPATKSFQRSKPAVPLRGTRHPEDGTDLPQARRSQRSVIYLAFPLE
jgi:hypothetical protein